MEQVNGNVITTGDIKLMSWYDNLCRKVVFKHFSDMSNACIEVIEGATTHQFGDVHSPLIGQVVIHDVRVYRDFVKGGSIGAAESYIAHRWSSPNLTALIRVFAKNQHAMDELEGKATWLTKLKYRWTHYRHNNSEQGSKRNILAHYDLGNSLYKTFLDQEMMYSCALYDQQSTSIESAQLNKLKVVCEKLELQPSDHLLEIGTGWGGLAIYAATNYGCKVTTTTISDEQYEYAKQRITELGLDKQITLLKKDYRQLKGQYDKLVSIEMIEAVGDEYFSTFFTQCNRRLKADGKLLIQSITIADQRYEQYKNSVDFIQKYIFPGGCLPSIEVLSRHISCDTDMMVEQIDEMGLHYARTLSEWQQRFQAAWPELEQLGYDMQFKRLWQYYLSYCEGAFLERVISTHHIVARKPQYLGRDDEKVLDY
jgi:cyclopropane-fatty-acyl-phospholipid synthase